MTGKDVRHGAIRSLLFIPGDSERKLAKAPSIPADRIIIDLEDAVAPGAKLGARAITSGFLARAAGRPGIGVRVNGVATPWYLADLLAVVPHRPDFLMLPKCDGSSDVLRLDHQLDLLEEQNGLEPGCIGILPLVTETAAATLRCMFTGVTRRLIGLGFAAEDLSSDLGIEARAFDGSLRAPLHLARATVVLAAGAANVPAIDTPYPRPNDLAGLEREAGLAVADGFSGKMCIHPDQVQTVNSAFAPSDSEVAWAQAVVAAIEEAGETGVAVIGGQMVDRPHLERARRILVTAAQSRQV